MRDTICRLTSLRFRLEGLLPVVGAALLAGPTLAQDTQASAEAAADVTPSDIVITASRREERLGTVPLKIDALNQAQLDRRGIRSIDDVSRFTPGLLFTNTGGVAGNSSTSISIRGITSDVGSATTAIYIDETPIQIRNIGYFGGSPYPRIFDLDRVEVLKGPQGTLFGASAEGGAVRFITPAPSLDRFSSYARGEIADTANGATSYEVGGALGGPIVTDKIGFRVSASQRRDGGYIDRVDPTNGATVDKDANRERTTVLRGALGLRPVEALTITPSIFYQHQYQPQRSQFWEGLGHGTDDRVANTLDEPRRDRFFIPAVRATYDTDGFEVLSNTSWFDRRQRITLDYTNYLRALFFGDPITPQPGVLRPSAADVTTKQQNFTQELRIQSKPGGRIDWVAGAYYSNQHQVSDDFTTSSRPNAPATAFSYTDKVRSRDKQLAGFVNIDLHATDALKLTVGVRVSELKFAFTDAADGPVNGGPSLATGRTKEHPVTPKFGISYQLDPHNLFYANAAKGFRQGGAQAPVPADFCGADLATLGLAQSPATYDPDTVWSFDGGAKSGLMRGRLNIDANAFWIKWKSIQQPVNLPNCGFQFIANLGKADSRGLDLVVDFRLSDAVRIGGNVGYVRTTYADDVAGGGGTLLAAKGSRIGGPQWSGTGWGQLDLPIDATINGYFRTDATFRSRGPALDPRTFSFDPVLTATRSSVVVSARLGVAREASDLSMFVNNLFNADELLSRTHDVAGSPLYYGFGYRPRTVGMTLTYRR